MIITSKFDKKSFERHSTPNLDYGVLKEICRHRPKQIAKRYKLDFYPTPEGQGYYFQDNGADVLAID